MDKEKVIGQYRMRLGALMRPVMMHGFQDIIPGIIQESIPLAIWFAKAWNGEDIPPPRIRGIDDFGPKEGR